MKTYQARPSAPPREENRRARRNKFYNSPYLWTSKLGPITLVEVLHDSLRPERVFGVKPYLDGASSASHKTIFRKRNFSCKSEEMLAETATCGIPYRHRTLLLLVK
jgi:hypothetical protein